MAVVKEFRAMNLPGQILLPCPKLLGCVFPIHRSGRNASGASNVLGSCRIAGKTETTTEPFGIM